MWIVALALRRPYTFVMAAILILILGIVIYMARAWRKREWPFTPDVVLEGSH